MKEETDVKPLIRLRVSKRMKEMLDDIANEYGMSRTGMIRSLIREKYENSFK